jgi:GT2 family glycosyltransferase
VKNNSITVVITTFNDSNYIIEFLDGIRYQTLIPASIVIIDGGSRDDTVKLVKQYSKSSDLNVDIVSDGRKNIAEGFNYGIKHINTEWVLLMGTGNSYNNRFIEELANSGNHYKDKVIYSSIVGVNKTRFGFVFNKYFLNGNGGGDHGASNHGVLIHNSIFQKYGYFWEGFFYAGEDTEFFKRLDYYGVKMRYNNEAISYWETPQNWKDYINKMKVNSIADWQIEDNGAILFRCATPLLFLYVVLYLIYFNLFGLVLALSVFFLIIAFLKKTLNVYSILLGVLTKYVMLFFYIKNVKYSNKKYYCNFLKQELKDWQL